LKQRELPLCDKEGTLFGRNEDVVDDDHSILLVTLAIETGARFGVIRTLHWGSVDFENRCLRWGKDKTASGTGRIIPLNQRAMAALGFWATHFPERKGRSTMSSPRSVTGPLVTSSVRRHTT
jgi:integrase